MSTRTFKPDPAELRCLFDETPEYTVGVEEEVMLLDPHTLDLAPVAAEVLERLHDTSRFKPELPAAHLEIVTSPARSPVQALTQLGEARRDLMTAAAGIALPAVAGVHPFADPHGVLSARPQYEGLRRDYGPVAEQQLVASLQVHVAVGGADRTLAVYNALRCHLPELMALAANGPFHAGRDTGLATVRPLLSQLLPRQGIPPRLESWNALVAELEWGAAAGCLPDSSRWWWELRPHLTYGTLELRVPDAQSALTAASGVIGLIHALVLSLAKRYDAGEPLPDAETWRIAENRFSAVRWGIQGSMADLSTGERRPTSERLLALIEELSPAGTMDMLAQSRELAQHNGALDQRRVAASRGMKGLAAWLVDEFARPLPPGVV